MAASSKTIDEAFVAFDDNLKLDKRERDDAVSRWNEVAEALEEAELVSAHFLQGSFARKTMRKPLKDVDVVVVAASSLLTATGSEPRQVFDRLQSEIRSAFSGTSFEVSKHALTVSFADRDFSVDITPAQESGDDFVLIANAETGEWVKSDCRRMNIAVRERNGQTDGLFVHQARMAREVAAKMKEDYPGLDVLNGLVAESILFSTVAKSMGHADALLSFLEAGSQMVHGSIYTPSGYEDLTDKRGWLASDRDLAGRVFESYLAAAQEAVKLAESGDDEAARDNWAAICGDNFPGGEAPAEDYLRGLGNGSATSAGGVTTSTSTAIPVTPQRAWKR